MQSITRPGLECSPMVFGLFLQRLDQIQLRAVRRNMQQHKLLFQHSAVKNFRLNVVVRRSALSIVQGKQSHGAMTIVRIVVVTGELGEHGLVSAAGRASGIFGFCAVS